MKYNKKHWTWKDFRATMTENLMLYEKKSKDLLNLVRECDEIVLKIIDRPLSYAHTRPQDFVSALLATRSFRLSISVINISLSGYPDAAPNLTRTMWEIGLWLFLIQKDPIAASIGFLLSGVESEIKMVEYDYQYRKAKKQYLGNLPKNLQTWKDYKKTLESLIQKHGLSIEVIRKNSKKISFWKVCKNLGLEYKYKTYYAFMTGHIHERGFANDVFLDESQPNVRKFILGPVCSGCIEPIVDALYVLIGNLAGAAAIVGERKLEKRCQQIGNKLARIWVQMGRSNCI